jgi:UDP-3-O-[3-hydroxymyristoyl] glucosamine N-acyltransferase
MFTLAELCQRFSLSVVGGVIPAVTIRGVAPLHEALPDQLSFFTNPSYAEALKHTAAAAVIVGEPQAQASVCQLLSKNPYAVFAQITALFHPEQSEVPPGIHPSAVVDPSAQLASDVCIGPLATVGAKAVLGEGTILEAGVHVGARCSLGRWCHLFPGVVLYPGVTLGDRVRVHGNTVIGCDGFGYAQGDDGVSLKVPQIGSVRIEEDVEIGAACTIDRGAQQDTVIGKGTKIDNLVQVAHGVRVGEHSLLVAQCGISGSAVLGNHSILAGQSGVVGHVTLADGVVLMARGVATKHLDKAGRYGGFPAVPEPEFKKMAVLMKKLPRVMAQIQQELQDLKDRLGD